MTITDRRWGWFNVVLALALLPMVLVGLMGCNLLYGKTITVSKGIARFSFERPEDYEVAKVEIRDDLGYTDINLLKKYPEEVESRTLINVSVMCSDEATPDAKAALDYLISLSSQSNGFQVLEHFTMTVAGIEGQGIVFSYNNFQHDCGYIPIVDREVYFDQGGLIWSVSIKSYASAAEAEKADFEHLLQTFKILD